MAMLGWDVGKLRVQHHCAVVWATSRIVKRVGVVAGPTQARWSLGAVWSLTPLSDRIASWYARALFHVGTCTMLFLSQR